METIDLICGCRIVKQPAHLETCKCGDEDCRTGYWEMETPCGEHMEWH
jgi:hypothetical protein